MKEVLGGGEDEEVGISIQTLLLNRRKASQINLLARNGARVRHKWIFLQLYGGGMALALVPSRPQQWHHPSRHSKHFPTGLMFSHRKYLLTGSSNSRHHHRGPSNCQHNRLWFSSSSKHHHHLGPNPHKCLLFRSSKLPIMLAPTTAIIVTPNATGTTAATASTAILAVFESGQ